MISFHDDNFVNPSGLVDWIASQAGTVKLRPDHSVVVIRSWDQVEVRLAGARDLALAFADIATADGAAA